MTPQALPRTEGCATLTRRTPDQRANRDRPPVAPEVMLRLRRHMDYDLTRKVLAALECEGVKYVVFGAVALALHGLPRATEDR